MRPSVLVETQERKIIIDTSSDFRQQCIHFGIDRLDAVLYTHHHFDHIAGFDDLRAFNFTSGRPVPVYLMQETLDHLQRMFQYAFEGHRSKENSAPVVGINVIDKTVFNMEGIVCTPIPLMHGSMKVNGYRFGRFAYCTDCNEITTEGYERLEGVRYLILDGLRYRPHPTHLTIEEAVETAGKIGAEKTWLTHIAHDVKHAEGAAALPEGIELAFDGLRIELGGEGEMIST